MAAPRAHHALLATIPGLVEAQRKAATGRVLSLPGEEASGTYDTVLSHLWLCTVPDLAEAVGWLAKVVGEGQLLFVEHVLARTPLSVVQRAVGPAWANLPGGCHVERDVVGALREGGFVVTDCERPRPWGWLSAGSLVVGRAIVRRGT